jgi:7-carboxy-7-deazaguanine synthase
MRLRVNEMYGPVLQGEGPSLGTPVLFVRLAGCNLHCRWCDTPYTWNYEGTTFDVPHDFAPKSKMAEEVHEKDPEEVARWIAEKGVRRVVFSGGEPMIQQKAMAEAMGLCAESVEFEVETNGTFVPDAATDAQVDQYNVSPKLAHSGNATILRRNPKALAWFAESAKAYFKFVVSSEEDMPEVLRMIDEFRIPLKRALLMPKGHTKEEQDRNKRTVYGLCLKHGLRYTPRLHIDLFGSERGI